MKEKDYEKLFEDLKDKEDYELHDSWFLIIILLLCFGSENRKKEPKTIININLESSDINV